MLIQHPEGKASGITFGGIGLSFDRGPVVKIAGRDGQEVDWMDRGLKPNAAEFATSLDSLLRKHLESQIGS